MLYWGLILSGPNYRIDSLDQQKILMCTTGFMTIFERMFFLTKKWQNRSKLKHFGTIVIITEF